MQKKIEDVENEIINEFSDFTDWEERFQYLIEVGESLPPMPEESHKDQYLVPGCQSKVWVVPKMEESLVSFSADSDTAITKGLIALLIRVLNNRTPEEIQNAPLSFIEKLGLQKFLSMNRRNGLNSMVQLLKSYSRK
jgi:cysteine desulfuration protein SufE